MPKSASIDVVLGFDFGMRRIGVAVGQLITHTANPLEILAADNGTPNWEAIQQLIDTWHVDAIVVGIPLNMDGTEQNITLSARQFAKQLANQFHLPVYEVDERLTTKEAKRQLHEQGVKNLDLKYIDSYAAKLILESWLNDQH